MIYLTFNDPPSGIYSSQVIDVCDFLNENLKSQIRLIAIISLRNFAKNKARIKSESPSAIVLPMFPGIKNWAWNLFMLLLVLVLLRPQGIIARGPFAASLALKLRKIGLAKAVCFDARGAYDAEFNEYDVSRDTAFNRNVLAIEEDVLLNSDFRIAVSNKLVEYWKIKFKYDKNEYVVIPCTVNSKLCDRTINEMDMHEKRSSLGFSDDDIIFVYSGSAAGWQSLKLIDDFLYDLMARNEKIKVLFLANELLNNMRVRKEYGHRLLCTWISTEEVQDVLSCCDYGILIREDSVTNRVASPVKLAEYLASGLKVIISENVGDYSSFLPKYNCGYVIGSSIKYFFPKPSMDERRRIAELSKTHFRKSNYLKEYLEVSRHLS